MSDSSSLLFQPSNRPKPPVWFDRLAQKILQQWNDSRHEIWEDLRSARWQRAGLWILGFMWTYGLLVLIIISNLDAFLFLGFGTTSACLPDGSFSPKTSQWSFWNLSGFFQVTLGFGSLSFTMAKLIDVTWDIVLGRGGQTLLAFVSWRAFAKYVTMSMEVTPVTYETFQMIFLRKDPSAMSLLHQAYEFVYRRCLISKLAMTFMILSMTFVLAFPTLASAMTAYTGNIKAYIQDPDKNWIAFSDFSPVLYVIEDGWRINLTGRYIVGSNTSDGVDPLFWDSDLCSFSRSQQALGHTYESEPSCFFANNVSAYVLNYGFFGLNNTNSTFMNQTLAAPALNISAFYIGDSTLHGYDWTDPRMNKKPFNNESLMTWSTSNQTYDPFYMTRNGNCQSLETYKWGFSFIQLFLMLVFLLIWTIGTYSMWLRAHIAMKLRDRIDVAGGYKAVVELAAAMDRELSNDSENPRTLTERQLRYRIKKRLKGGSVSYPAPISRGRYSFRKAFANWLKREKWWLATDFLAFACSVIAWIVSLGFFLFSFFAFRGISFAMMVGRTNKGRLFIIVCSLVIGSSVVWIKF